MFLPLFLAYTKIKILVLFFLGSDFIISPPLLDLTFNYTILFLTGTSIIIIFFIKLNLFRALSQLNIKGYIKDCL